VSSALFYFLIFVNDLPDSVLSSKVLLFADDTMCFKSVYGSLDSHSLQLDIHRLSLWSILIFNERKCVSIPKLWMSSTILTTLMVNQYCYMILIEINLGILMSHIRNLSWNAHCQYVLSNAYSVEPCLACLLCPQNKRSLYLSLVKSKLTYNSPVWQPQFIKDITVIEQVQRCATKYILRDYTLSYKTRLISLKLFPLMMQLELNDIFFVSCLKHPTAAFKIYDFVSFSIHYTRLLGVFN